MTIKYEFSLSPVTVPRISNVLKGNLKKIPRNFGNFYKSIKSDSSAGYLNGDDVIDYGNNKAICDACNCFFNKLLNSVKILLRNIFVY